MSDQLPVPAITPDARPSWEGAHQGVRMTGTPAALDPEVLAVARDVAAIVRRETGDDRYHVFLFGSWVAGNARSRSDVDIGIDGPRPVDPETMMRIREACETLPTLYTIDLVDFAQVAPRFRDAAMVRRLDLLPAAR
jgi:predicted nucleotidyltransferase